MRRARIVPKNPESIEETARRARITREAFGYTQNYMGLMAGGTDGSAMWYNYEKGINFPERSAALALCRNCRLTLAWIYQGVLDTLPGDLIAKILEAEIRLEERGEIEPRRR